MSEQNFIQLFFNVLPLSRTFLHKLVLGNESRYAKIIKKAFSLMKKNGYEMPIIMDHAGRTPFDRVLCVPDLS